MVSLYVQMLTSCPNLPHFVHFGFFGFKQYLETWPYLEQLKQSGSSFSFRGGNLINFFALVLLVSSVVVLVCELLVFELYPSDLCIYGGFLVITSFFLKYSDRVSSICTKDIKSENKPFSST